MTLELSPRVRRFLWWSLIAAVLVVVRVFTL